MKEHKFRPSFIGICYRPLKVSGWRLILLQKLFYKEWKSWWKAARISVARCRKTITNTIDGDHLIPTGMWNIFRFKYLFIAYLIHVWVLKWNIFYGNCTFRYVIVQFTFILPIYDSKRGYKFNTGAFYMNKTQKRKDWVDSMSRWCIWIRLKCYIIHTFSIIFHFPTFFLWSVLVFRLLFGGSKHLYVLYPCNLLFPYLFYLTVVFLSICPNISSPTLRKNTEIRNNSALNRSTINTL